MYSRAGLQPGAHGRGEDVSRTGLSIVDKFTSDDDDDEDEPASPRRTAASVGPNEH
jgi:hypothetical protein